MFRNNLAYRILALLTVLAVVIGCSEDTGTDPGDGGNPIQLVDVAAIIESVAPPEYSGPATSPAAVDTIWTDGQYPLLSKVFGSRDPQTLYANIEDFKLSLSIVTGTLLVDDEGEMIAGTYVDSHLVEFDSAQTIMMHFTAVVSALSAPTDLPDIAHNVVGTSVDVDYLIEVAVEEMPAGDIRIGITLNDTIQTICQWDEGTSGDDEATRLFYASLDTRDSSFVFKGIGYCNHPVSQQWPNGDLFSYAYSITAAANSDFTYRMSYFSDGTPGMTFLHCFLGGGNKDTEFALAYRMFSPADTTVCDSTWLKDQVFGPDYTQGAGLISAYADYLADSLIFPYEEVPQVMIPDPWE